MSFAYEIQTIGDEKFYGNAVRFETPEEAEKAGAFKWQSWTMANAYRVVEKPDQPANYRWIDGKGLEAIPGAATLVTP